MPLRLDALRGLKTSIMEAVEAEATDSILTPAQARIPVESGRARDSGRVVRDGNTIFVTFGRADDAGGGAPSNEYIEALHEDMERAHPAGEAKFLERSAHEAAGGFAGRVARRVKV